MAFEPNCLLERSLVQASADPAHRPQFYKDLAASDLYFIEEDAPPGEPAGRTVLEKGRVLKIRHIDWQGSSHIPVFSSLPRLQAVLQTNSQYLAINATSFMEITRGAALILNPGSEYGKEFTPAEIDSILDGSIWQPSERHMTKQATQILLGQPATWPVELVSALSSWFKKSKSVKKAYLALYQNPEQDLPPHTLIALEVSGDWDATLAGAGIVVGALTIPDPPVDFVQISGAQGLGDYFQKNCRPFYQRKFLGLI